ncbi:MAG: sodium:solute symporter [Acidobacteriota bacterium]|jgi:SSS family transporter|nr:sodium:solute symporter [Acidobacteriota bacterium]NLT32761.1 sodium/solute symporter [Acidobacteriota bacterium]
MGFNWLDWIIVLAYLLGITLFGLHFRKKQQSMHTYFLGGKTVPAWALALSIVGTETSTLTIISTPGIAFAGNLSFLQLIMGYLVGRVIISLILIPAYFKGEMYTAYELMQRRFGPRVKHATASMFLVTRALAEGVRVFAIAIVVGIVLGSGDIWSILIISALTLIYTFQGGFTAVIWTDVVQLGIYLGCTAITFFVILGLIPNGWEGVMAAAGPKFAVWNFSPDISIPYTFWAGIIGGAFLTTASHGVDQLIVQRLLAAKTERDSKIALLSSGVIVLLQFTLFLVIGIMLYSFYHYRPDLAAPAAADRIFPDFIVNYLPHGVRGIMVAAILAAAMSNLSSALNAMASTTVVDFVRPFVKADLSAASQLRISRWFTVFWGVALAALAVLSRGVGSVLEAGLTIASITYGSMLGVFLLGVLTKRANERGAILGMAVGLVSMLGVWAASDIAFTWYVLVGTVITFATGYGASLLSARNPA